MVCENKPISNNPIRNVLKIMLLKWIHYWSSCWKHATILYTMFLKAITTYRSISNVKKYAL